MMQPEDKIQEIAERAVKNSSSTFYAVHVWYFQELLYRQWQIQ